MGEEKVLMHSRLSSLNAEWLDRKIEAWAPFVEGQSAAINLVVTVLRGLDIAGMVDLSPTSLQGLLRILCLQEKDSAVLSAAETELPGTQGPQRAAVRELRPNSITRLRRQAVGAESEWADRLRANEFPFSWAPPLRAQLRPPLFSLISRRVVRARVCDVVSLQRRRACCDRAGLFRSVRSDGDAQPGGIEPPECSGARERRSGVYRAGMRANRNFSKVNFVAERGTTR